MKPCFGLVLVIYQGHVNYAVVAVGIERTQTVHYLAPAFIRSVLEVLISGVSCQILKM